MAKKWYLNMKKVDAADPHGPTVKLVAHRVEAGKFKRGSVKWSVKTKQSDQHVDFAAFDPKFNPETSDATDTKTFAHEFTFPEDISGVVYKFGVAPNSIITPNIKELAEEYETWKRVYFTLNYMAADSKALFDKAKPLVVKELARAGIELVEHESLKAGGPDEPMTLQGQDLAFVDRNKGDLTHAPYHIRVHMLRDIAGHEKNKKLTGVASAEAGDFQYVAQGEKLVLHTRAEQSKIDKFFSIDELVLTMGLDKETVPADKIKVRGATILVDLTPERLLALKGTSCAVKAKITGKAAETSSSALKLKITPTTTRELPAQDPDGKVGAWLDGDVLHIKTQAGWQVSAVLGIKGLVYGFGNKKSGGELSKTFYYEDEGKVVDDTSVTFDLSTSYVKTDGPNLAVPKHLRGSAAKRRAELEVELALWKAPKADAAEVTQDFSESADVTYAGGKMVLVTPLVLKAQGGVPDLKISALGSKMTLDKDQVRDCVQTPDDDEPTKDVTF
ncbi:MAG: hypothetical protein JST92_22145, partial [Deltaproteobacteria bacterium]|nr:hypothetical protein [Deltaproteobacteria bacterium]